MGKKKLARYLSPGVLRQVMQSSSYSSMMPWQTSGTSTEVLCRVLQDNCINEYFFHSEMGMVLQGITQQCSSLLSWDPHTPAVHQISLVAVTRNSWMKSGPRPSSHPSVVIYSRVSGTSDAFSDTCLLLWSLCLLASSACCLAMFTYGCSKWQQWIVGIVHWPW